MLAQLARLIRSSRLRGVCSEAGHTIQGAAGRPVPRKARHPTCGSGFLNDLATGATWRVLIGFEEYMDSPYFSLSLSGGGAFLSALSGMPDLGCVTTWLRGGDCNTRAHGRPDSSARAATSTIKF